MIYQDSRLIMNYVCIIYILIMPMMYIQFQYTEYLSYNIPHLLHEYLKYLVKISIMLNNVNNPISNRIFFIGKIFQKLCLYFVYYFLAKILLIILNSVISKYIQIK